MSSYTIKDLEKISGIKAHTIRIWEQRYQFLQPQRTETNIRTYSADELKTILNVSLLNKYGFKISHIDKMSAAQMEEKIFSLTQLEAQKERVVNNLIKEMVSLNMLHFEKQLDLYIAQQGIEKTIIEIIFPFLERVGILWVTNHINPAQEHLASNIIRQKIILGIEKLPPVLHDTKRIALFMPEGEYHELGLLFVHYLLKQKGVYVDYLGSSVPFVDIEYLINHCKVPYLYCHLTSPLKNFKINQFFEQVGTLSSQAQIKVSGQLAQLYKGKLAPGIQILTNLGQVMEFIAMF